LLLLVVVQKLKMEKKIPMDVKVGDKVLFGTWSGTEVKIDGKEYSIIKESDIMGISTK
jgi:chaperonin GroES